ncbi:MAG: hypothetical protein HYZ91_00300, partial [Candidatus Omnitrophica bacterium]|nr:hypothetical protein [Candidatus Omnitrophota bacterium]
MRHRVSQVFVLVGAVAFASLLNAAVALAADTTRPTKPLVTDDGTYTALATSLHATWTTSTDPESGVVEYQYQIRQDATTGAIIADWTSTRTSTSVTRTGLNLPNGKKYFFAVKARNGAGLWSFIGYSNGITVDTTAPSVPGAPTEGSTADLDYDSDGAYPVYWPAAADAETGVVAYELQERVGTSGAWTTLTNTSTTRSFAVTNRQQASRYFYQVRAKNGAGLWGAYSATSDGILVDKTAPATPTVTDDGAYTGTSTSLHASWSASDPESGLAEFQYQIRRDSIAGTLIVN